MEHCHGKLVVMVSAESEVVLQDGALSHTLSLICLNFEGINNGI